MCPRLSHDPLKLKSPRLLQAFLTALSEACHSHTVLVNFFIKFVTSFNALIMLSHTLSGPPYAGANDSGFSHRMVVLLETFHREQLTKLTNVCERDGSSSLCFSYQMCEDICALPHDMFVKTLRVSTSSTTWFQHFPKSFLVHRGLSSSSDSPPLQTFDALESIESHLGDHLVNHYRSVVCITEKFLYIVFHAFCVLRSSRDHQSFPPQVFFQFSCGFDVLSPQCLFNSAISRWLNLQPFSFVPLRLVLLHAAN